MSKRRKLAARTIAPGDEEEWTWISLGASGTHLDTTPAAVHVSTAHLMSKIGVRDGGKISVLECAKIALYYLPSFVGAVDVKTTTHLWLSSTGEAPANIDADVVRVNELCKAGGMIWLHQVTSLRKTGPDFYQDFPHVYDVETHDGHGLMLTTKYLHTCIRYYSTIDWGLPYSYCWRLLVRQVWVDPAYYLKEQVSVASTSALDAV